MVEELQKPKAVLELTPQVEEPQSIDILDRSEIVKNNMAVFKVISEAHSSCTFALNGKWGVGKTFVLDLLQEQLKPFQESGAYIVFHYNCWQYDFFLEPLVGIASAMAEEVDKETHLLKPEAREKLRNFGKGALQFAKTLAQQAIPLAIAALPPGVQGVASKVYEYGAMAADAFGSASQSEAPVDPDGYFHLKKQVDGLRKEITTLAEDSTVIVLVDELDRCLPEYAIKVLERLHHIFDGITNTAVLIATDKSQLEHTVQQIYGSDVDAPQYLKKFIRFELNLDAGTHDTGFWDKYRYYKDLFAPCEFDPDFELDPFAKSLFEGLDMREQDRLVERAFTVHKMLFPEEKKDYAFMCAELAWLVLNAHTERGMEVHWDFEGKPERITIRDNDRTAFDSYLSECWNCQKHNLDPNLTSSRNGGQVVYCIKEPIHTGGLMVVYLWNLKQAGTIRFSIDQGAAGRKNFYAQIDDLRKFDGLMRIIT